MRAFKQVLSNRNALLRAGSWRRDTYMVLTEQMWQKSREIEMARTALLAGVAERLNAVLAAYFDYASCVVLKYKSTAGAHESFDDFGARVMQIEQQERRFGRSVFGAHLDDFAIDFCQKKARAFASRGQQKLMTTLFKLAQIELIRGATGVNPTFLVDDFMTDFDESVAAKLLKLLDDSGLQLLFTSPCVGGFLSNTLLGMGGSKAVLTI